MEKTNVRMTDRDVTVPQPVPVRGFNLQELEQRIAPNCTPYSPDCGHWTPPPGWGC